MPLTAIVKGRAPLIAVQTGLRDSRAVGCTRSATSWKSHGNGLSIALRDRTHSDPASHGFPS